jgi:allophanate hydrolase
MNRPAHSDSLDLQNIQAHFRSEKWTAEAVAEEVLRRIDACEDKAIWISRTPASEFMRAAANAARQYARGDRRALLGAPFAVKDNIDVAGQMTTAACPGFAYRASRTSPAVTQLLDAGAILIGKTNLDQFATGLVGTRSPYGTPKNLFDPRYIPGGSSSGSAVAVSAGLASFALGTDTAGSGRVPAAFSNIIGLKPTPGRISTSGVVPACRSLDCVSIFALNCFDAAMVMAVATGYDVTDDYSRQAHEFPERPARFPSAFRFGIPAPSQLRFFGNSEAEGAFRNNIRRLSDLGGTPVEIDYEPFASAGALLYQGPWLAERMMTVRPMLETNPEAVLPVTRQIVARAPKFNATDAFSGMHRLKSLTRRAQEQWEKMELLVVPTAPTIYTLKEIEADPRELNANLGYYTNFVNLMDLAAVAIPTGFDGKRLPSSVSLIARAGSEAALLALGDLLHRKALVPMGATGAALPANREIVLESEQSVQLAVVGAHLSGQPLNHQLVNLKAQLVQTCQTAKSYALYALANTQPPKPGLVRCDPKHGAAIEVEVWELTMRAFGAFVALVPPPMAIGTLELEDGIRVKGFLCEPIAIQGAQDITAFGSWRAYLKNVSK